MKKCNCNIKSAMLCVCIAFILCLSAFAITPRDMIENGEVSDGSVIFGDERDGIVSDVSSEMNDVREEIDEFAESAFPNVGSTEEIRTEAGTSREPMTTDMTEQTADNTDSGMDARLGVVIAVIIVVAVVAAIFLFVRRK